MIGSDNTTRIVMGNADEVLKSEDGFYLTATNEEDGVAVAIKRFILG